jgi:hypothetical protein
MTPQPEYLFNHLLIVRLNARTAKDNEIGSFLMNTMIERAVVIVAENADGESCCHKSICREFSPILLAFND